MFDAAFSVIDDEKQRNELAEFYSKHKNRLCSIALSKLHNKENAEDAVQEVFSEIADKPESFFDIPPEKRLAYTDVMVRNIAIEMFNSKNKIEFEDLNEEMENALIPFEDDMFASIAHNEILSFMKQLPTEQKSVLLLHCFFGLTIYDTSQRLNISMTTANKRLATARKAIKGFIDERNADYE